MFFKGFGQENSFRVFHYRWSS